MAGPLDFDFVAAELLDVAVESLNTLPDYGLGLSTPIVLLGAPDRQYVSPGQPVLDCPQVTVHGSRLGEDNELGTTKAAAAQWVNMAEFTVQVVRCITVIEGTRSKPKTPAAETLMIDGRQGNADAWVVWMGLHTARKLGRITDLCQRMVVERGTPLTPSGALNGWQFVVQTQIDGYTVDLPGS